jgi:hypothetical protein
MSTYFVRIAVACILVVGSAHSAVTAECSLATLNWMARSWHNVSDPHRAQERWAVAPEGVLMGSGLGKSAMARWYSKLPYAMGVRLSSMVREIM